MKKVLLLLSFIAVRRKLSGESLAFGFRRIETIDYRHFEAVHCRHTHFALPHPDPEFIFRFVSRTPRFAALIAFAASRALFRYVADRVAVPIRTRLGLKRRRLADRYGSRLGSRR
ncbi:hypothetical protein EWE75_10950 [Sphingomonas populi]|uniref:Uncharacterized protein n=1 Tax=Sphingomonas populi TaxID=2484750 RepID=A0A4Q6XVR7_9SPHN|nr:hypothetical protein [Sphingomonas populi]RZF64460.1 hypothetical protein EWE75_10950 [Sphingomonas populi]